MNTALQIRKVEALLSARQHTVPMPAEWLDLYRIHQASEFRRIAYHWWPFPLLVFMAGSFYFLLQLKPVLSDSELVRFLLLDMFMLANISAAILISLQPWGWTYPDKWTPWAGVSSVSIIILQCYWLGHSDAAVSLLQLVTPVVFSACLILRMSVKASLLTIGLITCALSIAASLSAHRTFSAYLPQFVLASTLCPLAAFFRERIDRTHFLSNLLQVLQKEQLTFINGQLENLALKDPLTGLHNRRAFDETLVKEIERARRTDTHLSLLFVDVDHFKAYNDTYGHIEGDQGLVSIANCLSQAVKRPTDMVARYGGEEFVVLLPNTDLLGAQEVATNLLEVIDDLGLPNKTSPTALHVTVSVGCVSSSQAGMRSAQELIRMADEALYRAKAAGRHCVAV